MPYTYAHNHYHLLRMKEMGRIYWSHSLGMVAVAVIGVRFMR